MAQNLIAEIAKEFVSGNSEVVDIVTFCEAPWGLNVKLFPTQRFVLKAFYGLPLDSTNRDIPVPDVTNEHILYTMSEADFLKFLYAEGRVNTDVTEGKRFNELIGVWGRRAGKSALASWMSVYELYKLVKKGNPSKHYGFPPVSPFVILDVAPTDDLAKLVFDATQSGAMRCPYLKNRIVHTTMDYFDMQTDEDMQQQGKARGSMSVLAGGCSSNGLRGRNAIMIIMDEMAFFIDNNGRFSGAEVYKALQPSTASFKGDGKVLCLSSPYAKFGKFYDRYVQSFDEKDITLMFKMYTAMVNPTIQPEILRAARKRDRTSFMCEFGGEFSDTITAWIEDESELKRCVTAGSSGPSRGVGDVSYFFGIDLGFKNDGSSVAVVHKDVPSNKIVLDYANVWYSGSSDIWEYDDSIYRNCNQYAGLDLLRMSDIVNEIKSLNKLFPSKSGIFDQHNGYALAELFAAENMKHFEMQQFHEGLNSEIYQLIKRLYSEQLLSLYDHCVLIPELLSLEAERRAKDKVIVRAPKRPGAHDDISDAFCRAVWLCYNNHKNRPLNISTGAGGRTGIVGVNRDTAASFALRKLKMHGEHPRGLYGGSMRHKIQGF